MKLAQMEEIGKHIANYRKKAGMTQLELAAKTDLSLQHIGYIENGRRQVTLKTLINITNALEVNLSTFFLGIERADDQVGQLVTKLEYHPKKETYLTIFNAILDASSD
ncbi:helix-turn-helix domain-containing protein [Vagococcus acidifermentans]|nr:helix-turn-helix transcriptional regulator [Vagococcus acidifermentans]